MLQFIRSFAGSWVVKILFVLLIASFAVWGIGDVIRQGGSSNTMIEVGPVDVGRTEVDQEFRRQMERLRPLFGGTLTVEQARQFGVLDQAIATLVQRNLYDLAAQDAGLAVGMETVRQRIAEEPAFRDQQGRFNATLFQQVLRQNGLSEDGYVQILRREIAREMVSGAVGGGAVAPKPLVEELFRFRQEKRVAEVITIPNASVGDVGTPDDAAVQRYYEDHQVRFTAPEYRTLTVLQLSAEDLAKDVTVPDEQVRAAYDERSDEFTTPERRTVQMVVVDSEEKAKQIADAARGGQSLADAAKAAGTEPLTLDSVTSQELPEIGPAVFALPQGQVSAPVKSALGWHVATVTAVQPGAHKSFEEVRGELLAQLKREKAADRLYEVSNRLDDALAGGATLAEVAQGQGLKTVQVAAVDSTGKAPDGTTVTGVANLPDVLKVAFGLPQGRTSNVTETKDNSFFAVHVDGITPAAVRPLAEVKADVIAGWQEEERAARAAAKAKEVAEKLKAGNEGGAQDIAAKAGGSFAMTAPFTRDARTVEGLSAELVRQLFAAKPEEVVVGSAGDRHIVARLKEVIAADPAAPDAPLGAVEDTVLRGVEGDIMTQFAEALRQQYPVEVHRALIDQMYPVNQ
ncbi:MAG TPA: peptidyl-prolyl cis-trans isomerase [Azospirillum sp.]|nr:peptidyl-prolyl cis-trans isomerase [Azospirillum sp.]